MTKVKAHWRKVKGKRVRVKSHNRKRKKKSPLMISPQKKKFEMFLAVEPRSEKMPTLAKRIPWDQQRFFTTIDSPIPTRLAPKVDMSDAWRDITWQEMPGEQTIKYLASGFGEKNFPKDVEWLIKQRIPTYDPKSPMGQVIHDKLAEVAKAATKTKDFEPSIFETDQAMRQIMKKRGFGILQEVGPIEQKEIDKAIRKAAQGQPVKIVPIHAIPGVREAIKERKKR